MEKSKDEKLKSDMPATFEVVETSTGLLVEAAKGLSADKESREHKTMLLDGSRGERTVPRQGSAHTGRQTVPRVLPTLIGSSWV